MKTLTTKRRGKIALATGSGQDLATAEEVTRRRFLQATVGWGSALTFSGAGIGTAMAAPAGPADATAITPFKLEIPESDLEDLKRRLQATRWRR